MLDHQKVSEAYTETMTASLEAIRAAQTRQKTIKHEQLGRIKQSSKNTKHHSEPTNERLDKTPAGIQQATNGPRVGPVVVKSEVVPFNHSVATRQSLFQRSVTTEEMMAFAKYCVGRDLAEGRYSVTQFKEFNGAEFSGNSGLPFNFAEQQEALDWVRFVRDGQYKLPSLFVGCLDRLWLNWCGKGDKEFLKKVGIAVVSSKDKRVQSGSAIGFYRAVGICLISCDQVHELLNSSNERKYFFG